MPAYFAETEVDDLSNYLEYDTERYFVLEFENKIIGSGGINFEDDERIAKISWDVIDPEFQGKGFGKELLKYRIAMLGNYNKLELVSLRTSQLAYKFYEKNGFNLISVIKIIGQKDMTFTI